MELDWLRTYLAVLDRGGFTAAADQLHRSQSRVSAHIAALEKEFGVRLVDRSRRPPTATSAGRTFAEHARAILAEVAAARSAMGLLRSDGLELTVSTTPGIAAAVLLPALAGVTAEHSRARFVVSEFGWDLSDIDTDRGAVVLAVLPMALSAGLVDADLPRDRALWSEPIRALVPAGHRSAASGALTQAELADQELVLLEDLIGPEGMAVQWVGSDNAAGAIGKELGRSRIRVQTAVALAAAVRAGAGIGVAGAFALEQLNAADLTILDIIDPIPARQVRVRWSDDLTDSEVGRALLQAILNAPAPAGAAPAG